MAQYDRDDEKQIYSRGKLPQEVGLGKKDQQAYCQKRPRKKKQQGLIY